MNFEEFLVWEAYSRDTIDFKKVYVDIADDLIAGLLLSQIIYWYLPGKDGKSKLRVKKEGFYWIAKQRNEWWDEVRIKTRQFDRALKILADKEIVITKIFRFNGLTTTHVRLNIPIFLRLMSGRNHENVNPDLRIGDSIRNYESVNPLTETTTKTTKSFRGSKEPPASGEFKSKHSHKKLHQLYGHYLKYRRDGDGDYEDPRLYHPALRLWRGKFKIDITGAGNWRDRIIEEVGDSEQSLKVWRESMEVWTGISTNPNAPLRVISIFRNGGILDGLENFERTKQNEAGDGSVKIKDPLSADAIAERMKGWQKLQASGLLND